MNKMHERFTRAYNVLDKAIKEEYPDIEDRKQLQEINLMWLRNEANLWVDWEADDSWIVDGVHCDPNHPDNLSSMVFNYWKQVNCF